MLLNENKYKIINIINEDNFYLVQNNNNEKFYVKQTNKYEQKLFNILKDSQYISNIIYNENDLSFFEYKNAYTIYELINKKKINSLEIFYKLALKLILALETIHEKNIIHKNLNYNNILYNIKEDTLTIIDLSMASKVKNNVDVNYTFSDFKGLLQFISPEQTGRVNRKVDFISDFYTLGILFYYILLKKLPFDSDDISTIIHQHISKNPPLLNNIDNDVPENLTLLILKLLNKEPEKRYKSLYGIKYDLLELQNKKDFIIAKKDFNKKLVLKHNNYGRRDIISELEYQYIEAINKKIYFTVISGDAGIGKSTLVHELHIALSKYEGFYGEYIFEQFKLSVPYLGFTKILNDYFSYIFKQDKKVLEHLKYRIINSLKDEAVILTSVIPNLEILIGKQNKIKSLNIKEEELRFYRVIINLLQIISNHEESIIFFIDNLQWADIGTIQLIKNILLEKNLNNIFLINAYRHKDINKTHEYSKLLNILKDKIKINFIKLKPLDENDIRFLVHDTIYKDDQILSKFLCTKSKGNPFYINQLIELFNNKNLFIFDNKKDEFIYDINKLNDIGLSDDIVKIIMHNISAISTELLELLKTLSVLGNSFNSKIIMLLYTNKNIDNLLIEALEKNYLMKYDNIYKFSHDKIQESFYSLLNKTKMQKIHYKIANILVHNRELFKYYSNINLEISMHYYYAIELLNQEEKNIIISLNLNIAIELKKSSSYYDAIKYLDIALSILDKNDKNLYWDYLFEKLQILYILQNNEQINIIVDLLEDIVNSDEKHVALSKYMFTNNEYAIHYSIDLLNKFNINIDIESKDYIIYLQFLNIKYNIEKNNFNKILSLKKMKNKKMILVSEVIYNTLLSSYIINKNLLFLLAFKLVNISLKYGNNEYSAFAFSLCALYYSSQENNYIKAEELIKISLKLNKKYYNSKCNLAISFIINNNLKHYSENLNISSFNKTELNRKLDLSGQVNFRNYNEVLNITKELFFSNKNLNKIEIDLINTYDLFKQSQNTNLTKFQAFIISFVSKLKNYNKEELKQKYNFHNEKYNIFINRINDILIKNTSFLIKAIESFVFEDYDNANLYINAAIKNIDSQVGNFNEILCRFFYNLIIINKKTNTRSENKQYKNNMICLKKYAIQMPNNFSLFVNILKGYEHYKNNNLLKSENYFILALKNAKQLNSIFFEALINELIGKIWLSKNKKLSNNYLYNSHVLYNEFNAYNKASSLLFRYEISLGENKTLNIVDKNQYNSNDLNLNSILNASQCLSKELKTKEILKSIMLIIVKNVGATKCYIILNKDNKQIIYASLNNDKLDCLTEIEVTKQREISQHVINYINLTNKNLIVDEAYTQSDYDKDIYIKNNKIKSILAMPIIKNNRQKGILYCENNLISGTFSHDLTQTISILLSQLIISLDNSFVYENLENLVQFRTLELNKINEQTKDSITYASIIQKSLIPSKTLLKPYFKDYFLIWEPKDIVGGDIYLFDKISDDECLMMVIDCTGHGVSGAFVTMLVKAVERQIITNIKNSNEKINTADILRVFNQEMKTILSHNSSNQLNNVGFDGGIIYYNKKTKILRYSGAYTKLFYTNKDELLILKGDRHSIGYLKSDYNYKFTQIELKVKDNMNFYLSSDGFLDQNGGKYSFPFGTSRFKESINKYKNKTFDIQEKNFLNALKEYQADEIKNDDITFLAFKI